MLSTERAALVLLALGTVVFLPDALNRFVFPKLAVLAAGALAAASVPARGRLPRGVILMLAGSALILLVAALTGASPASQILGRAPRYEGIFVLAVYLACLLAGARLLGAGRARGSTAWFLRWLAIAALAVGIEALLETAGLRPLSSNVSRPGSLLGNASDEGAWALLVLGPLASVALRARGRLYIAGAIAAGTTLVCSGSRGALAGAVVLALLLILLAPRRALRLAIAAALMIVAIVAVALPATRSRVFQSSPLAAQTVSGRLLLWGQTARLLEANPVLGVGPSGYLDTIPRYHTRRYELEIGPANPPDSPHDWILQAADAGGLPLVLLALALAGMTLSEGYRASRSQPSGGEAAAVAGLLAGLAGYAFALLFDFTSPGTTPLAAVFAGALLAGCSQTSPLRESGKDPVPPRRRFDDLLDSSLAGTLRKPARVGVRVLLGGLVIVLSAGALAEIPLRSAILATASGHFANANRDFHLAEALRPWDQEITASAAHAYATLASDGIPTAAAAGARWGSAELAAYPNSIQALTDAATLDLAGQQPAAAMRLLSRALKLDPENPDLQTEAARAALAQHEPATAIRFLSRATALTRDDAAVWRELSFAYTAAGLNRRAAIAARRARELTK
jgi:O-antigen ligase